MTCYTDLTAISLTSTAKAAAQAKGVDLGTLVALAKTHTIELSTLLKAVVASHPSTGPDASNYAALVAIIAELA